ncbi:MAG: sulfatase-like hydrolase/transferase [Planctomycetota bacterium]
MDKYDRSRREFLKAIGVGAVALALPGCGGKPRRRPNILFIMSDDHAAPAISCYGGRLNKTPNIDRIASEGMRFDNCFCTNSICTPSRATILTGKYSHKNGCLTLSDNFDNGQQTFPKLLQDAGYYTAMVGKWHLKTEPTGFDYYNVLPGQGLYFNPRMKEKGKPWQDGRRGGEAYEGYVTDVITDITLDVLRNRPADKPFCLLYHHKAPHDEWEYDPKHEGLYNDFPIPEPETLYDDYKNRGEAIKRVTQKIGMRHTKFEEETKHLKGWVRKAQQYQIYMKKYLRCVKSIDDNVGRVLDYLDKSGMAEDTIVIYTSDQGFFLGEHGMYDKRFMYEESLRMPFVVRYPREIKAGSVAGVGVPGDMQGRSLRPLFGGRTPKDWPESMYYRYWMHGAHFNVAAHFGVRTKRYKLIYYYGKPLHAKGAKKEETPAEWELFDLVNDPKEMNNVYDHPAYRSIVRKLKAELIRLRRGLEDDNDGIKVE